MHISSSATLSSSNVPSQKDTYDVIVVGGGASGGLAVQQLTALGVNVLLVEAGPAKPAAASAAAAAVRQQRVQSRCLAHSPGVSHLFVDDILNPYVTPRDRPFAWIRGRQLGGKTHLWSYGAPRWEDHEFAGFETVEEEGMWPLEAADLEPHYTAVEELLAVVGADEACGRSPSETARAARSMDASEQAFKEAVERRWPGRRIVLLPYASPFGPNEQSDFDRFRRYLVDPAEGPLRGCTALTLIPTAMKTGRLTVAADTIVCSLVMDDRSGRALGVNVISRESREKGEFFSRSVMLCASTLESTRILLNSKSRRWPTGVANSSGALGCYLTDHLWGVGVSAVSDSGSSDQVDGLYPPLLMPPFPSKRAGVLERFQLVCYLQRGEEGRTYVHVEAHGEASSSRANRVTVAKDLVDAWGVPGLKIDYQRSVHDFALARRALEAAKEVAEAAGFRVVKTRVDPMEPGISVHEAGTARMGTSPETSVLNAYCQAWDVPNLFVPDGSAFPRAGVRNPLITVLALTHRASAHLVRYLRGGS